MVFTSNIFGSISAINATTLKVTFNKAVDTAKASFTVKKEAVKVNVSKVTFADDKTSATLELATKLTKGEYTVAVAGLETAEVTGKTTVEDEKVAKIELLSEKAAIVKSGDPLAITGATVGYKVYNQYNEDITKTAPEITWTAGVGAADDSNDGVLTFTGAYTLDQKVVVTGVEPASGTVTTKTLTMSSEAAVDAITMTELYNSDKKTLETNSTFGNFFVLLTAKDQYGNEIKSAANINGKVVISSSNPAVVDVESTIVENKGKDSDKLAIQLKKPVAPTAGTATIRVISTATGKVSTFDVTVAESAKVEGITLSAPAELVAGTESIEIPFTAVDQFGKEITDYDVLSDTSKVTLNVNAGTLAFEKDYVNKKAVLKFTAAGEGTYVLTAISSTYKVSQLTIKAKAAATPAVIDNVSTKVLTMVKDATSAISVEDLSVRDQWGREMKLDSTFFAKYKIKVEAADGTGNNVKVAAGNSDFITSDDTTNAASKVVLTGLVEEGTEKIRVTVCKTDNTAITSSAKDVVANVVKTSAITEYKTNDLKTIKDDADAKYAVDFEVYGVLADGTKVAIPDTQYTVSSALAGLTCTAGKLQANGVTFANNVTEVKGNVIVVVESATTPVSLIKEVTVSNKDAVITTIENKTAAPITVENKIAKGTAANVTVANLLATFKAKDQYGVDIAITTPNVLITNVKDANTTAPAKTFTIANNGKATAAISNVEAGDTFTMTIITGNGQVVSINVVAQ